MKPFNLEEFKAGKPAVNRAGDICKFVAFVPEAAENQQLIALCDNGNIASLYKNGDSYADGRDFVFDLVGMALTKKQYWVNLYPSNEGYWHETEAAADDMSEPNRIGGKAFLIEVEG